MSQYNPNEDVSSSESSKPIATEHKISHPSSSSWMKYILLSVILSIGYLLIVIDFLDELILPAESSFSFMLEEQLLGLIIPNIIVILIAPVIWSKVAESIMHNQVVGTFEAEKKRSMASRPMSLLGIIFGMKTYSGTEDYYIEAEGNETDLNNVPWIFKERALSAISSNIGFTFYIAFFVNTLLPSDLSGKDALFLSIMIMQLVPLLISWIVPVNWALKDVMIRRISSNKIVQDMGEAMSNGVLDRFIGIGGLIVGLNVAFDLAYNSSATELTNIIVAIVYFIFYFLLLSSGTVLIITLLYFNSHHQSLVNSTRMRLANTIPVADTRIDRSENATSELQNLELPSMSSTKRILRIIGILLLIGILLYCEYYVLVVIGPFQF